MLNPVDTSQPVYEVDSDRSMDRDGSTSEPVSVGEKSRCMHEKMWQSQVQNEHSSFFNCN